MHSRWGREARLGGPVFRTRHTLVDNLVLLGAISRPGVVPAEQNPASGQISTSRRPARIRPLIIARYKPTGTPRGRC